MTKAKSVKSVKRLFRYVSIFENIGVKNLGKLGSFSDFNDPNVFSDLRNMVGLKCLFRAVLLSSIILLPLSANDFESEVKMQTRADAIDVAKKPANIYIRKNLNSVFEGTKDFDCVGNRRAAECRVESYNMGDVTLKNFRYTVDYQDLRSIDRISGDIDYKQDSMAMFAPKHFECGDFTQINILPSNTESDRNIEFYDRYSKDYVSPVDRDSRNSKNYLAKDSKDYYDNKDRLVNEQLRCTLSGEYYDIDFRIRSKFSSPLFRDKNILSLLTSGNEFLNRILTSIPSADRGDKKSFRNEIHKIAKTLNKIDTNLYSIEVSIKKSKQFPQRIYEYLYTDTIYDNSDDMRDDEKMSKTFYNSSVGYIYGTALGYVVGNDDIDARTKDGLVRALSALRDSFMLDSEISRVSIKLTNRTKEGFETGRVFKVVAKKLDDFKKVKIRKENVGKAVDVINGDFLNRYRVEVGVYRFR